MNEMAEEQGEPAGMPEAAEPSEPAAGGGVRPRLIPGSDQTEGEIAASPAEEAELNQVVAKAMTMIHGRKSRDAVVKALHDPRRPVPEVVGRMAANILMSVSDQKAAATNEGVDREILREAASYVIPELLTVGCAAGIFPFDAPDDADENDVGTGTTEFDQQARASMLEAVKVYGEAQLKKPGADAESGAAADEWARGVSQEVAGGHADPEYMAIARPQKLIPGG